MRTESLTWQALDDEIVCLDLDASRYLLVNRTGATLWPQLVEGAETDDLVATLTQTFGADAKTARRDVATFVGVLTERNLLQPR